MANIEKELENRANWESLAAAIVREMIFEYEDALMAERRAARSKTKHEWNNAQRRIDVLDRWFESDYALSIMYEDPIRLRDKLRENFRKYGQVCLPNREVIDFVNRR